MILRDPWVERGWGDLHRWWVRQGRDPECPEQRTREWLMSGVNGAVVRGEEVRILPYEFTPLRTYDVAIFKNDM